LGGVPVELIYKKEKNEEKKCRLPWIYTKKKIENKKSRAKNIKNFGILKKVYLW